MEQPKQISNRKKFLLWGATLLSSVTVLKFLSARNGKNGTEPETIKMLSQDGRLVEIDKKLLASSSKKISNEELQTWIKK